MNRKRDTSLGNGVYYLESDYVGFSPRIAILMIDSVVVASILTALIMAWITLIDRSYGYLAATCCLAFWLYMVPLKRSEIRTIGYRIMRVKIVNLQGKPPGLIMLTMRSLLCLPGPLSLVADLIFCGMDNDRQSMRDRFAGTCLVRAPADPEGIGEIHLAYINGMGYTFALPRVTRIKPTEETEQRDKHEVAVP